VRRGSSPVTATPNLPSTPTFLTPVYHIIILGTVHCLEFRQAQRFQKHEQINCKISHLVGDAVAQMV
jgi:hypothetical protein